MEKKTDVNESAQTRKRSLKPPQIFSKIDENMYLITLNRTINIFFKYGLSHVCTALFWLKLKKYMPSIRFVKSLNFFA